LPVAQRLKGQGITAGLSHLDLLHAWRDLGRDGEVALRRERLKRPR
jgi:hypothetical protein